MIVSDTTPLISLLKINRLSLINQLFGTVKIPGAVYDELVSNPRYQNEATIIKNTEFIEVVNVKDPNEVLSFRKSTGLDAGESEAIILYNQIQSNLLLIDEAKGREIAKNRGISIMGTIGILLASFEDKLLSKEEVSECVSMLRDNNRHISEKLYKQLIIKIENS